MWGKWVLAGKDGPGWGPWREGGRMRWVVAGVRERRTGPGGDDGGSG